MLEVLSWIAFFFIATVICTAAFLLARWVEPKFHKIMNGIFPDKPEEKGTTWKRETGL